MSGADRGQSGRGLTTSVYFASLAMVGLIYGATAPTLRALAVQANVGLGTIGVVLSARSVGYLIGASQLGRFIDRRGSHRFMAGILFACAILLALVPAARSLWSLVLTMGLIGITLAGPDVGGNTLTLRLRMDRPGPYVNALHLFFGLGALIAPILVALSRSETSVTAPYLWLAGAALVTGVLFLLRPEPPITNVSEAPVRKEFGARRLMLVGSALFVAYVGAEVGFSSWVFEYASALHAENAATLITTSFWLTFTAFRLVGVFLALRIPAARILVSCLAAGIAACGILLGSPVSALFLWSGTMLLGAGIAAVYPTFIVLIGERIALTGRRIGTIAVASTLGSMSFPWLIGRLFTSWNPQVVPVVVGGNLLIALALLLVLLRQRPAIATGPTEVA